MVPDTPSEDKPRARRARWPVAGLALVLVAAAYALAGRPDRAPVGAADREPTVATVSLPVGGAAPRCAMPSPELLRRADLAVDGVVAEATGPTVTLVPSRIYTGGPADHLRVDQAPPSRVSLILGVRFEEGRRYLVASRGGEVMVCGFSGAYGDGLADLYDEAFGS